MPGQTAMTRALGWLPPKPEHIARLKLARQEAGDSVLSDIVAADASDNYGLCKVLDQGQLGSCTTQTVAQAIRAAQVQDGAVDPPFMARLALYWWARYQDGNQGGDTGTQIGTVFEMAAALGIPPESCWPYEIGRFAVRPGPEVYREGYDERGKIGINYHPLNYSGSAFLDDLERALTAGYLVAFGVQVSEAFCSQQPNGTVEPPGPGDKIAGGHALTAIGHDRARRRVLVLNSWGPGWRDPETYPGCCWFSYDYLAQSSDRWIVLVAPIPEEQP